MKLVIGTRGSALALIQAKIIENKLKLIDPTLTVETKIIKTEGDKNQNPIPSSSVGKAWFTKEIEKELLAQTIDIAVHSLKDLPNILPEELTIGAYLAREDATDILISKSGKKLQELPEGARIGTDSERRKVQLLRLRPDLNVKSIRGNVPTRIAKLFEGIEYDGVILAKAGLVRLGLTDKITQEFSIEEIMPAPGQGILAVETIKEGNALTIIKAINDSTTQQIAIAERAFSIEVGGGCKTPIGAYAQIKDNILTVRGMIATEGAASLTTATISGPSGEAEQLGKNLAKSMQNNE